MTISNSFGGKSVNFDDMELLRSFAHIFPKQKRKLGGYFVL
jgi:hypothetical protein